MSTICGLAVNTLSLIENGKSIPTINTLQNIANSLKIPITSFFDNSSKTYRVDSVKKFDHLEQSTSHGYISPLYSDENNSNFFEPYFIKIFPFSTWGTHPITHSCYEFVYCFTGIVEFTISDNTYSLNEGDSILFHSKEPHIWSNPTDRISSFLFILIPLEYQEKMISKYI